MFVRYLYCICPGKALPLELYLREPFPREDGFDSDVCEKGEKNVSWKTNTLFALLPREKLSTANHTCVVGMDVSMTWYDGAR
jgi:hypothetical protein